MQPPPTPPRGMLAATATAGDPAVTFVDEYARVTLDAKRGLVVYKRSELAFVKIEHVGASFDGVVRSLQHIDPRAYGLLMDMRDVALRADPAFEEAMRAHSPKAMRLFSKAAVLVRSAVGKLQMNRIGRERAEAFTVFDDERAAIAYLCER